MVPKKRHESRTHLSRTERLPDLLAQANRHYWYKLLVDADDRAVLDHELGKLKRGPNPNVHQIYNVLAASKIQHAIGQRNATWLTHGHSWFKRRTSLLKDVEALPKRFLRLYEAFNPTLKIPLKAGGARGVHGNDSAARILVAGRLMQEAQAAHQESRREW